MNQAEIWFGIISRKTLRGASFSSIEQLTQAIKDFVAAYNHAYPVYTHTKLEIPLSFQIRGKTGAASIC